MLGLFSSLPGKKRNIVASRFGSLSILADRDELILQGNGVYRPSHVFEMHSRPGFSGSPVFLYRTPATDIEQIHWSGSWNLKTHNNLWWGLLGIHSRQFWESGETEKAEAYGSPQVIVEGDNVTMPSSMTIIVPAQRIKEMLLMPKFEAERKERETAAAKPIRIRPEVAESAPDTASNPDHLEDFTALLGAVAKGRSPKDRT